MTAGELRGIFSECTNGIKQNIFPCIYIGYIPRYIYTLRNSVYTKENCILSPLGGVYTGILSLQTKYIQEVFSLDIVMNKLIHYLVDSFRSPLRTSIKHFYTIVSKTIVMSTKELLIALVGVSVPKGELKAEMFSFHNSMVGKSKYFRKNQNPKTACGSCIQGVRVAIFKWYHSDETAPSFEELVFSGKLGIHNIPVYKLRA